MLWAILYITDRMADLLRSTNLIFEVLPGSEKANSDVEYNERFWWRSAGEMSSSFKQALYQGAPFPIVSLVEYFSLHQEGFSWGSRYREAGYYASIMLWYVIRFTWSITRMSLINDSCNKYFSIDLHVGYIERISFCRASFASWMMMNLLLMVVPRYGAYSMIFTGLCMLTTNLIYTALLPCEPLIAHIEGSILSFNLGWNYWLVLLAGLCLTPNTRLRLYARTQIGITIYNCDFFIGAACLLAGLVITAIDLIFPHQFSTILEVDYDTPYDRHVIIEESFDTRNVRRKVPKIEDSFGDRIMRSALRPILIN